MSTKHFLPEDDSKIVHHCLKGILYECPTLSLLEKEKVVFNNRFEKSKVSIICGGGSGHEPGMFGFVGKGMITAAVQGDVFASPNYKNVQTAEKAIHSDVGTLMIITNYTGDNLYFGMAAQELIARFGSSKVKLLRVTDDVAVGRSVGGLVGRRTLAGLAFVNKIVGAAAEKGLSLDELYDLGSAVNGSVASINAGLDHVHIPGHARDSDFGKLGENQLEIGLGVHNEPGVQKLDYIPRNEELVSTLLKMILDKTDSERGWFDYTKGDKIVVLINNLGGVSALEEKAILFAVNTALEKEYGIVPVRVYSGYFFTSLNAPTFTLSLFNITNAATAAFPVEKLFEYLDDPTEAFNWPKNHFKGTDAIEVNSRIITDFQPYEEASTVSEVSKDIKVDAARLERIVRRAAKNVIDREPELTDWDTKMGDGDCGHTLKHGAECVLAALNDEKVAETGSLLTVLHRILTVIKDDMGGTLGAILFIFMKSVINKLQEVLDAGETDSDAAFGVAFGHGITTLCEYTKAREGHRTVMDVLIPFCKSFAETKDIKVAAKVAEDAAEGTRLLRPKLGRATYVGGTAEQTVFPPDPGAYGVYEIIAALVD